MGDPALKYEQNPDLDNGPGSFDTENEAANGNMINKESEIQNTLAAEKAAEVARRKQALKEQIVAENNPAPANDNQSMDAYKQRALAQIAKKKSKLEQELADLEKDLTNFKNERALKILGIFHPGIEMLIDTIINEIKKRAKQMSKEARIKFYEKMISLLSMLLGMLKGLKLVGAFLDAAFIDKISCLRLVILTLATIIIPIILIIVSPLYILFLAILIYINKVPLMKGVVTELIEKMAVKVKKQKTSWENELKKLTRDVALKKQIAKLEEAAQQIQSGQISYRGRGPN